jgi:hypothetical protein
MKFGCNVVVKKRMSCNRGIKRFEQIGQLAKYLGTMRNSSDGHYVLVEENGKVLKTSRIVPYGAQDEEEQDQDLKELGWKQLTDPEGGTFYLNEKTGEKSWDTPLRLEEVQERPPEETTRKRLNGKQPPPAYLKEMKLKRFEVEEDDAEVTKTISLHEVYKNLEEWKESIEKELNSQYGKGCLIPIKDQELKELAEKSGSKIKMLPTKLVAVLK